MIKRLAAVLCALLVSAGGLLHGQNISLRGSYAPPQTGFGDVWGNGNIACMGVWLSGGYANGWGVGIFDISDPTTPTLITTYNFTNNVQNRFEQGVIRSNILYVGSWGGSANGSGCHILSITNPASPVLLSRITKNSAGTVTNGFADVHTLWLERNFLYLAAHNAGTVSLKVFNVSNPSAPFYIRDIITTNTTKVHQMTVGMKGTNTILYTSGWGGFNDSNTNSYGQTDIWDVSNVDTQPAKWLGRVYSGYNSHSSWPTADGNMLVVNRETPGGEVSFYDISTPPKPTSSATPNPQPFVVISPASMGIEGDIPHNPVIIGNLLFVSWYQNGLQIFDITDRTKPVRIGSFDTYPSTGVTNAYAGNWGIYPQLGMDKLLVSDINSGFYILDATAVLTATNNYPPLLIRSPTNQTSAQGATSTLTTTITGSSLNYRWFFNGSPISTATNSSLVISNTLAANSGNYFAIASNTLQSVTRAVTSSVATLSVTVLSNTLPSITAQPQNVSVYPGQTANFSVGVVGAGPFFYQWRFKSNNIPDATNSSFAVQNVQGELVGTYSVLVTNAYGSTLSSNASLIIIDSPYISGVRSSPGAHGAVISWTTTMPADSQVQFDPATAPSQAQMAAFSSSASFSQASYTDRTPRTNHSILLTGLTPSTSYNFQVVSSTDTNSYISGVYSFTTAGTAITLDNTNSEVSYSGNWSIGSASTDKYGSDYRFASTHVGSSTSNATYRPNILIPGKYDIRVYYPQGSNRATNAAYLAAFDGGSQTFYINQQTGGGGWRTLATAVPFAAGTNGSVTLLNSYTTSTNVVLADGMQFVYVDSQDFPTNGSIPAWWSTAYFGTSNIDPAADTDLDGYSNAQEFILGTSPTAADDKLHVSVFRSGATANIIFSPYLGDRAYTVLHSTDLAPNWTLASVGSTTPDAYGEGVFSLSVTNAVEDFYRLGVQVNSGGAARPASVYTGSVALSADTALSPYSADPVCGPNRAYLRPRGRSNR